MKRLFTIILLLGLYDQSLSAMDQIAQQPKKYLESLKAIENEPRPHLILSKSCLNRSNTFSSEPFTNLGKEHQVGMCDEGESTMDPEQKKKKSIYTFGLERCTAVGIYVLSNDGKQKAYINHHPDAGIAVMQASPYICNKLIENPNIKLMKAIISCPGNWKKIANTWKLVPDEKRQKAIENLRRWIGHREHVLIDYYSRYKALTDYHDLEIVLAPDPKESYWQSKGSHNIKHFFEEKVQK